MENKGKEKKINKDEEKIEKEEQKEDKKSDLNSLIFLKMGEINKN